ncbi:MAG: sulfatase-like hydrolase/transferase, partial [Rubripirellula sp.]
MNFTFHASKHLDFHRAMVIVSLTLLLLGLGSVTSVSARDASALEAESRPNIVVLIADDWSWPHASSLGDPVVKTPNFDRVANEGVLMANAFVSTPSCTPSRLSILTGQHHWRLQEGDSLGGSLRETYPVYTEMLQKEGYQIGRFGKGVWPSKHAFRNRDSFGERYRSFDAFLKDRSGKQPFCYWHGGQDPHRPYELNVGQKSGMNLEKVQVPACLPDTETVRGDVADYLWEVQRFDREVGEVLQSLERIGELENTIVVVTSDNGMPFPRCKATLYDLGTRVPLAIRWGQRVQRPVVIDDFVSLCDLAPTFLDAAGLAIPEEMTGRSWLPLLDAGVSGQVDPTRTAAFSGNEKHVYLYPARSIRTKDFLYIRNWDSSEWPSGVIGKGDAEYDFASESWPTEPGAFSYNIDPSPSKQLLRRGRQDAAVERFATLAFTRSGDEELYDLSRDPDQLENVADRNAYASVQRLLRRQLDAELIRTNDPRTRIPEYDNESIEGWPIRISTRLRREQPEKTSRAIELLTLQLSQVSQLLPTGPLEAVRTVPIWISPEYDGVRPTAEYHPGGGWLEKVGRRPELLHCVELTNVNIFEREHQRMPMMILHELAHAYHHQVLDFEHPRVRAAYEQALSNGSYDSVLRGNGKMERAYAMNNHKEYFAETSEAFFGQNDFYPFTSDELSQHDPRMHRLLASLWSVEDKEGVSANGTTQGSVTEKNATAATKTRKEKQKSRRDQRKLATSDKATSDKATSDKATSDKATSDKTAGDKA